MTNAHLLFRSLIIYAICLPLAIFLGYQLSSPDDLVSIACITLVLSVLMVPIILRWHYAWMVVAWNASAGLFFLPGKPSFALMLIGMSFMISALSYIMNRNFKFTYVPSVMWPLLFITAVILVTAKFTHSLGLNMLGSETMGGKRYIYLLTGVIGFFALTAQRIPPQKANWYVGLFFLGGLTAAIGSLISLLPPAFWVIYWVFPADIMSMGSNAVNDPGITRLAGLGGASVFAIQYLLARYGLRGVLSFKSSWRPCLFFMLLGVCMLGGYRGMLITIIITCVLLFYREGLMYTSLLPATILAFALMGAIVLPFANKLPLSMQRSLAFLPLDLDYEAIQNANASVDWRIQMWKTILPTVPQHLILGKGLGIDPHELAMLNSNMRIGENDFDSAMVAGDYHNGPLSVIVPFGIFGVVGFVWFLVAGYRVLLQNYRYGDPDQITINRFLLVFFMVKILIFCFIFGSFYSDLVLFTGPVGLSIALNNGVRKPEQEPAPAPALSRFRLVNAAR